MRREILHINTDDFYASAVRLRDPGLRGRPVIIAGPPPRGMVLSASYEARGDGVERGMTVSSAGRLCPRGEILPPDWELFRKVSRGIFGVLGRYSPVIEAVSLDEGYVDYTGCGRIFGHVLDAGSRIKAEVRAETGLDVSLGVASNKLVSHVASRTAKRAHMVDVYPGCERSFVAPVDIARFPIVPRVHVPVLRRLGIRRVGDVLSFSEEILSFCFGPWGRRLYRGAMGDDPGRVRARGGDGAGLRVKRLLEPDVDDRRILHSLVCGMSAELGGMLRRERLVAGKVVLEIAYADSTEAKGTVRLPEASSDDHVISNAAGEALERVFRRRVRVRRMALSARRTSPEPLQIGLFPGRAELRAERSRRLQRTLDRLRESFPAGAAPVFGSALVSAAASGPAGGRADVTSVRGASGAGAAKVSFAAADPAARRHDAA